MSALAAVVAWSLRHRVFVLAAALALVVVGVRSAVTLPIDAVPDITNVQVQVITTAPALSPVEVEQYVTVPVERAMAGIPRSNELRSISKYGLSVVTIGFDDGTDMYFARQLVSERLREVDHTVNARFGRPELAPVTTGLGEIYQFVIENDALTPMQLEELLDWTIAPALRTIRGVSEVNTFGGEDREYQVVLDPLRLQASGLSIAEIVRAMEKANANAGGGYIEHAREHFVIGTRGLVSSLDDLRRVVVGATKQGVPITLATVGEVRFGPRLRLGAASKDGKGEVVVGVVMMLLGENARVVTSAVKQKLAALQPSLPAGTKISAFYDRSALVDRTIETVAVNLAEGALLVIFVLFLLLGDLRAGLVVAAVIPLALLFAVACMRAFGVSGNLMSLGAIDFGLLVDGAVIIVENTSRRMLERARSLGRPLTAAERVETTEAATLEVRAASFYGELIIAVVYLPILGLVGVEGKLFRPMATTVLFALAGAFVLSLTVVPVLASYVIAPRPEARETRIFLLAERLFERVLSGVRRRRTVVVGGLFVVLVATGVIAARLGAEFVPQLDEGDLVIEARRLPGVALSESVATDMRFSRVLKEHVPEVLEVVARAGAPEIATDPMGLEQSDVYVRLKPQREWRPGKTKADLAQEMSDLALRFVPEISAGISQPIQMRTNELLAGVRSDVAAIIYGQDLEVLRSLGDAVAVELRTIPGAEDVRVEQVAGLRYLTITPDRQKLARYGLTIDDINEVTETLAVGHRVGEVLEGERRFAIVVLTAHGFSGDIDTLRALPLKAITGQLVPLGDVATVALEPGPAAVDRSSGSRRLIVELNVRGQDLVSVVAAATRRVHERVRLPVGYRVEWGGQFQHYAEAKARLAFVVPAALFGIALLLWLALRSARRVALVLASVPFAVIGGVLLLAARAIPFSISAAIGFIALFGVSVLNALVLLAFIAKLEREGGGADVAFIAARMRLRPVLMTAFVAALGFVPTALSTAPGSEVQRPLATVVIGGILSATFLTLVLLPLLYRRKAHEETT